MRILLYVTCLIINFGCSHEHCPVVNEKAVELDEVSEREFLKGNIDLAIKMCDEIIVRYPNNYVAFSNRGAFKHGKNKSIGIQYQEDTLSVYNDIKHSFAICPNYSQGYRNLIATAHDLADHNTVIEYSNIYVKKFRYDSTPYFDKILTLYAFSLHAVGRIAEAKKYLDIVINNYSADAFAFISRGKCFRELKQYDKALEDFNRAINLDTTGFLGHHERAYCFKYLGNFKEAEHEFLRAIEKDPNRSEPYYGLGVIRTEQRDTVTACQYYFEALKLNKGKGQLIPYIDEKLLMNEINKVCIQPDHNIGYPPAGTKTL